MLIRIPERVWSPDAPAGVALEPALRTGAEPCGRGDAGGPVLTAAALEDWVAEERKAVSDYLGRVLRPDRRHRREPHPVRPQLRTRGRTG